MDIALYTLAAALWLWAVVTLLLQTREPSSTLSWVLFVTMVPVAGPILFFFLGPQRIQRKASRRQKIIERRLSANALAWSDLRLAADAVREGLLPRDESRILQLATKISGYDTTQGNRVDLLISPERTLEILREEIRRAERFIHLQYYIIANDEVTEQLFSDLVEAARRGVEVRVLFDAVGSLFLKKLYFRKLIRAGVKIAPFLPFSLVPHYISFNFRNHRKIVVIDGKVAFTGGTNIGREYLGPPRATQWRDQMVRLRGPVVNQLEDVFAKDWHFTTKESLFESWYYPEQEIHGQGIIQVIESGPDSAFRTLHKAIFLALNSAREEILLTTPYFIPDPAIQTSLAVAALKGVKVRLLFPAKSDLALVRYASRSFYEELLEAGAEIYEYQPRILHAKQLIIDRKWTMQGSANMDIRSFRLNFELNLLIYGKAIAEQAAASFEADLSQSRHIRYSQFRNRGVGKKLRENACRLLSPVL